MAGKAKSVYLTVTTLDHKSVFHRMFFNAKHLMILSTQKNLKQSIQKPNF